MYKIIKLENSPLKTKRFRLYLDDGSHYDFGLFNGHTYLDHHDVNKRSAYRARHYAMEKKFIDNLIPSAALFSYYLLWNTRSLDKNIKILNKKFAGK